MKIINSLIVRIGLISKRQYLETGVILVVLSLLFFLKFHFLWLIHISIFLSGLLIVWPVIFRPFALLLLMAGELMGNFMSRLILILLFFLIITPIAILRRAIGKNDLHLRDFGRNEESVFENRDHVYVPEDLEYPF